MNISRTAVIFHGIVHRSLDYTARSIHGNLLAPLARRSTVDVFYHSWDVATIHNPRAHEYEVSIDSGAIQRYLPNATGVVESQDAFDAGVDWTPLLASNLYNGCALCEGNAESAASTLRNLVRAAESRKRAFEVYRARRESPHDLVIGARADMFYPVPLHTVEPIPGYLYVPRFHDWRGVNDRFAMGREAQMSVWFGVRDYLLQRLLEPVVTFDNSEELLRDWLDINGIAVQTIDFVFRRVRATGAVAGFDQAL